MTYPLERAVIDEWRSRLQGSTRRKSHVSALFSDPHSTVPLDFAPAIPVFLDLRDHPDFTHPSRCRGNRTGPFTLSSFRTCKIIFLR